MVALAICPLISICKEKVDFKHYMDKCSNIREDKYPECEHYKRIAGEVKTPLEWRSLLTPPATT